MVATFALVATPPVRCGAVQRLGFAVSSGLPGAAQGVGREDKEVVDVISHSIEFVLWFLRMFV